MIIVINTHLFLEQQQQRWFQGCLYDWGFALNKSGLPAKLWNSEALSLDLICNVAFDVTVDSVKS